MIAFIERHHFLFRRLHSLSGIVPIGVFLLGHLTTNSTILWGAANARAGDDYFTRRVGTFQKEVNFINELPFLLLIEISLWLGIGFHAILGVYYARTGNSNTKRYAYQDNKRYTWQRWSGYIALIYIFYHVATLRWGWTFLIPGGTKWDHSFAGSTMAAALRGGYDGITPAGLAVSIFYFVGVTASIYHFANGLWTAAITWGLTVSEAAQRRWGYACAGLGAGLMALGWGSVIGFAVLDPNTASIVEQDMLSKKQGVPIEIDVNETIELEVGTGLGTSGLPDVGDGDVVVSPAGYAEEPEVDG